MPVGMHLSHISPKTGGGRVDETSSKYHETSGTRARIEPTVISWSRSFVSSMNDFRREYDVSSASAQVSWDWILALRACLERSLIDQDNSGMARYDGPSYSFIHGIDVDRRAGFSVVI